MTKSPTNIRIALCALFGVLLLIGLVFYGASQNMSAKNAPHDPVVADALDQARALQKQGALLEAFTIFERHALQGFPEAMFHTAKAYIKGWGVDSDLDKARHYLLLAVEYGFSYRGETAYEIGRLFQRSHGVDCNSIAVEWFKKSLEWHYDKAALQLAIHYEKGLGVEPEIENAVFYYQRAIETGNEQAHIKFARLLMEGKYGLTANPKQARKLVDFAVVQLNRKAVSGSPTAAKQLGRLFRDGKLVNRDLERAEKWLRRGAYLGSEGGMHDLARLLLMDISRAEKQEEAISWLRRAAEKGHGGAMTSLGRYHLEEKYGLQKAGAVRWFELGVAANHGGSMEELARLYAAGVLVRKDPVEALRLAKIGSRIGHSGSKKLLLELQSEMAEKAQLSQLTAKRQE